MRLLHSETSPFARKALVVAHEAGLITHVQLVPISSSPIQPNPELLGRNPLAKLPALLLDDGTSLYDSRVVTEYLDSLAGPILYPRDGAARWTALRRQALADGLMDAAILIRYELVLRAEETRSQAWIDGQFIKLRAALDALEAEADELGPGVTIGEIAIGCALGYLDFRFAKENWRANRAGLAAFYGSFAERASMVATRPPANIGS